jgi:eukaryotic-like serine/threonine-protein kinase
VDKPEGLIMY